DVDGGQSGEDESLNRDDDHDFEQVEDCSNGDDDDGQDERLKNEEKADERENQDVARRAVREKSDAQRDEAHDLAENLEWDDQRKQTLRRLGDPALEVLDRPVPADP